MRLYIVRHALAVDREDPECPADDVRPLTPKGRRRFARLVKQLAERGFAPQRVATSPLVRCRQTAELIVARLGKQARLDVVPELAPGAQLTDVWRWIIEEPQRDAALVAHAPDVSHLLAGLIGDSAVGVHFGKGAVAAVEFAETPRPGEGFLRYLVTPRLLR